MRTTYSVSFQLGRSSDESVEPIEVAKTCLDWVFQWEGTRELPELLSDPFVSLAQTEVGSGATIELINVADGDEGLKWACASRTPTVRAKI